MTNREFINKIAPIVQDLTKKYGYGVPSAIIAQACLESAYGTSEKAKYHNYFGLKYRPNRVNCNDGVFTDGSKEQNKNGSYRNITATWYSFASIEKGVEGYLQFISVNNYAEARKTSDPKSYLQALKDGGYATSINYVQNNMSVIEKWHLTQYDSKEGSNMRVNKLYLIAGHGAGDSGACGNGYQEQERVRKLVERIKYFGKDDVVVLDTKRNWYADRGILSLTIPNDCALLECHMDSAGKGAHGGHVIIAKGLGGPDEYDKALAKLMVDIFPGRANSIVERGDLANPNRAKKRGINYRLVEFGFISDANDVNTFNTRMDEIAVKVLSCFGIGIGYLGNYPTKYPKRGNFQLGDGYETMTSFKTQIKRIQKYCNWMFGDNKKYVKLNIDGRYDEATKEAVLKVQKKLKLKKPHGNWGPKTTELAKAYKK